MRAIDGSLFFNNDNSGSATSEMFMLEGGAYVMDLVATGSGSVTLKRTGPDLATQITAATAMTATGTSGAIILPGGNYTMVISGLTGVYASLTRVAGE